MTEIKDYEGLYAVTRNGKVWSFPKKRRDTGKWLKGRRTNGYRKVTLVKDGMCKQFNIHRLVAVAYIPNPNNWPQVNHINGIKDDNRISNLEWVTAKANVRHGHVLNGTAKLSMEIAEEIRSIHVRWHPERGTKALAKKFKVMPRSIRSVLSKETWN